MSETISHDADQPAVDRGEQLRLAIESGNVQDALKTSLHLLENNKMSKADLFLVMLMCLPDDIEGAKGEWNEAKLNGDVGEMVKVLLTRTEWWKIIKDSKNGSADLEKIINRFNEIVQANLSEKDEEIRKRDAEITERMGHYDAVSRIRDDLEAEIVKKDELIAQLYSNLETAQGVIDEALKLEKLVEENINITEKNTTDQPDTVDHARLIHERNAEITELKLQLEKLQAEIEAARQLATVTINENNEIDANRADITTKRVESDPTPTAEAKSDIQKEVDTFIARGNVENSNYSEVQKLFVGVYRKLQPEGDIQHTEDIYHAAMNRANEVLSSPTDAERSISLENLKNTVRQMINEANARANNANSRIGETSEGDTSGVDHVAEKAAEDEPIRELEIEGFPLRSIERGKPSVNVQIKVLGDNLDAPSEAYFIDEDENRASFKKIIVSKQQPKAITLSLNNCDIPKDFSPNGYSASLVLKFRHGEARFDNIIVSGR